MSAAKSRDFEMWPGPLDDDGNPPADCSNFDRLYEVSRLDILAYEENGSLTTDLLGWPTGLGAPTFDANGDLIELLDQPLLSRIDRVIDLEAGERPAIQGDQSIWWVMNDRGNEHMNTESLPIGMEVHAMAYAFIANDDIDNTTFYKYTLHYKGTEPLLDSYFSVYADVDLGDFSDDYIGSDSLLGLGYGYNADNDDDGPRSYGTPPPAAGFDFLQGPIIPSPGNTAVVNGMSVPDYTNLEMTSFATWWSGNPPTAGPRNGDEYYSFMKGRWRDGERFTEGGLGRDFSEIPTNFMFNGDPVVKGFWTEINMDGLGTPFLLVDGWFLTSTGPFTMHPGDEQEIVFAIVWAKGEDHLDSVRALREADIVVQNAFDAGLEWPYVPIGIENEIPHPQILNGIKIENLYPNPFRSETSISFEVPSAMKVNLIVYDMLGREVSKLVDGVVSRGTHTETFNASGLPSGSYLIRLETSLGTSFKIVQLIR